MCTTSLHSVTCACLHESLEHLCANMLSFSLRGQLVSIRVKESISEFMSILKLNEICTQLNSPVMCENVDRGKQNVGVVQTLNWHEERAKNRKVTVSNWLIWWVKKTAMQRNCHKKSKGRLN